MASDSWGSRFSTSSSRRHQIRPGSDLFEEERELEDDPKAEYLCPFCAEDFDVLGLCCHMDEEHPVETKNGVCPVCAKRVGLDIVGHITTQHQSLFKISFSLLLQSKHDRALSCSARKRRLRKGGPNSTFSSLLKKELRDGSLQSLLGGSTFVSSTEPDPLLSSFMFNPSGLDEAPSIGRAASVETTPAKDSVVNESLIREVDPSALVSKKETEEKSRRCEFVRGLVLSTILDEL
ncbi:Protein DEHYDRATION-INDUCED 19 homolog 7 [Linum perenne]